MDKEIDKALRLVLSRNGVEPSKKLLDELGQLCWLLLPQDMRTIHGHLQDLEWRYLGKR